MCKNFCTLRPFAALWAISKWAKSEIAQSESVGYLFNCALVSCAAGMLRDGLFFVGYSCLCSIQIRPNGFFLS
jgi:hypothetical protein